MERSRVLLRFFRHMDQKEYEEALADVETYRVLDPSNLYLSECELLIQSNIALSEASAELEKKNYDAAGKRLEDYLLRYGTENKSVNQAAEQMKLLQQANRIACDIRDAAYSEELRSAAQELKEFAQSNKTLFPNLGKYADSSLQTAERLSVTERGDALALIFQDAIDAFEAGRSSEAEVLTAFLELEAEPEMKEGFSAFWKSSR